MQPLVLLALALPLALPQEGAPAPAVPEAAQRLLDAAVACIDERGCDFERAAEGFTQTLRAALPPRRIRALLAPLRDEGAVRTRVLERREAGPDATVWTFLLEQEGSAWVSLIAVDAAGRVAGWFLKPAPREGPREELRAALEALEGDWGLAVVALDAEGRGVERVELGQARAPLPLGSVYKLYVLAELARQVGEGRLALDQDVAIRDAWKSLPSGTMHELEAGARVPVRELARAMVAVSDNTAADHLLHLVGRERVEQHLRAYHVSEPERNLPFLASFEMFLLKGLGTTRWKELFGAGTLPEVARAWRAGSPDQRRAWLAAANTLLEGPEGAQVRSQVLFTYGLHAQLDPAHTAIEWHASAADVVALLAAAHRGELVDERTSRTFLDLYAHGERIWFLPGAAEQGYKGGSEPHVFALSARIVQDDGRAVLGCLLRAGYPVLDTEVPVESLALFLAWLRSALETPTEEVR